MGVFMGVCVTTLLREKGFKVTPQRLAIYNVLAASKAHPSAEMIFHQLQPIYPTMSLATVYKTIEILKELGLIQVLNAGEDSFRYDADTSNHPHICCRRCGRVDDLHGVDSTEFVEKVVKTTPYRITGQQFYFYGVCPECAAKE
ncbi:Fur family transcriptional regulator, peroxide stress response regulator [Sporolituus thermophilus DSM 23256]|uniref:Fur family transcriptional regulator, peroxide stress response regulator n=2 Tax=Sporolituus TaxID=909931 RepID=A0A1G7MVW2_9FIRM|nr:Fur family transcriptional regulator, peroxide stress response regulator [Sporolituus thermophilus DSM 23256]